MNVQPLGTPRPTSDRLLSSGRVRGAKLSHRQIRRRRRFIFGTKWLLPVLALALLASVALWPEIERGRDQGRFAFRRVAGQIEGARLIDAQYRGIDERGRPFTLTAAIANQVSPERVNLTKPKGDTTLENGTWLMGEGLDGVYMQHLGQLDLSHNVTLYRDDGTTLHTESATIDLKASAAGGSETVHAEGPFGTLDAQGFALVDKGDVIQFVGPARLVLNGTKQ